MEGGPRELGSLQPRGRLREFLGSPSFWVPPVWGLFCIPQYLEVKGAATTRVPIGRQQTTETYKSYKTMLCGSPLIVALGTRMCDPSVYVLYLEVQGKS